MTLLKVVIISLDIHKAKKLGSALEDYGFNCSIITDYDDIAEKVIELEPKLTLVDMSIGYPKSSQMELLQRIKQARQVPIMALVHKDMLDAIDS